MSNQTAPSVRQHPPGLGCSLLASAACHGLALSVCLPSTFFSPAWHADALSLSGSGCVTASALLLSPHTDQATYIKWMSRLFEKRIGQKIKKLKLKRNFCWQENKMKSNLSSCLFFWTPSLFPAVLFSLLPLSGFFPPVPIFIRLTVSTLSLSKVFTTQVRKCRSYHCGKLQAASGPTLFLFLDLLRNNQVTAILKWLCFGFTACSVLVNSSGFPRSPGCIC